MPHSPSKQAPAKQAPTYEHPKASTEGLEGSHVKGSVNKDVDMTANRLPSSGNLTKAEKRKRTPEDTESEADAKKSKTGTLLPNERAANRKSTHHVRAREGPGVGIKKRKSSGKSEDKDDQDDDDLDNLLADLGEPESSADEDMPPLPPLRQLRRRRALQPAPPPPTTVIQHVNPVLNANKSKSNAAIEPAIQKATTERGKLVNSSYSSGRNVKASSHEEMRTTSAHGVMKRKVDSVLDAAKENQEKYSSKKARMTSTGHSVLKIEKIALSTNGATKRKADSALQEARLVPEEHSFKKARITFTANDNTSILSDTSSTMQSSTRREIQPASVKASTIPSPAASTPHPHTPVASPAQPTIIPPPTFMDSNDNETKVGASANAISPKLEHKHNPSAHVGSTTKQKRSEESAVQAELKKSSPEISQESSSERSASDNSGTSEAEISRPKKKRISLEEYKAKYAERYPPSNPATMPLPHPASQCILLTPLVSHTSQNTPQISTLPAPPSAALTVAPLPSASVGSTDANDRARSTNTESESPPSDTGNNAPSTIEGNDAPTSVAGEKRRDLKKSHKSALNYEKPIWAQKHEYKDEKDEGSKPKPGVARSNLWWSKYQYLAPQA